MGGVRGAIQGEGVHGAGATNMGGRGFMGLSVPTNMGGRGFMGLSVPTNMGGGGSWG